MVAILRSSLGLMFLAPLVIMINVFFFHSSNGYEADRIHDLPGLTEKINFEHFSGFLNATGQNQLFYMLAKSQNQPATDPLILWLNGGPGCSSLTGLFRIHGPYFAQPDGRSLKLNPNAWNRNASVIYLEAPVFTGFSKSNNLSEAPSWSDDQTSLDTYTALQQFFTVKFPEFRNHRFFIAGESYAGVSVPTLAERIVAGNASFPINLEGIAIGNGCVNDTLEVYTSANFMHAHGLIDEQRFTTAMQRCNTSNDLYTCPYDVVTSLPSSISVRGLNYFDMFGKCANIEDSDGILSQPSDGQSLTPGIVFSDTPCQNGTAVWSYLNQNSVRRALHVPDSVGALQWKSCSDIGAWYTKQHENGVEPVVRALRDAGVRVLLYYGDTDLRCDALLGQKFAQSLGYNRDIAKRPWYYAGDIGGMKTVYANGSLVYTTVRGAGHMAPINKGAEMLYAINQFMRNLTI